MESKTKQKILNLAADLRRISWWACDRKNKRDVLIEKFLKLAKEDKKALSGVDKKIDEIVEERLFTKWPKAKIDPKKRLIWAEETLTASLRLQNLAGTKFA